MNKITQANEWSHVKDNLLKNLSSSGYNPDLKRMLKNIDTMVVELSKQEVDARRLKKPEYTQEKVDAINKAINHLEKFILIATLMR
jgi:hypothetical protein